MITLYSGTPGSGKSLHMAKSIYYWLSGGKPVIANFEIDICKIKNCRGQFYFLDNEKMTPDNLISFSRYYFQNHKFYEGAIRLYLDEVQLLLNSRDSIVMDKPEREERKRWLSFFTQHRKYGYDVYLVAQFDRMIDRQVRSLIEYEFIHRKVDNYGLGGLIIKLLMLGHPTFCAVKYWYPLRERLSADFFTARKKYYSIYDTFNTFDSFQDPVLSSDFVEITAVEPFVADNVSSEEEETLILEEELS